MSFILYNKTDSLKFSGILQSVKPDFASVMEQLTE